MARGNNCNPTRLHNVGNIYRVVLLCVAATDVQTKLSAFKIYVAMSIACDTKLQYKQFMLVVSWIRLTIAIPRVV